jgi:hypothetical protein
MSVYLVVEPIGLIAADLCESIRDHDPDAQVVVAASAEDAAVAISGRDAVQLAILHMSPTAFSAGPLAEILAGNQTICVFMGNAAETLRDARFLVLQQPFSTDTVTDLLARLVPRDRARA